MITVRYYHVGNGYWDWFVNGELIVRNVNGQGRYSIDIYNQIKELYPFARFAPTN